MNGDVNRKGGGPAVEIVDVDLTTEESAKVWREAAFKQARRADNLVEGLKRLRSDIDALLSADETILREGDDTEG